VPKINGIEFENLGEDKTYRYLGLHVSLDLNWENQIRISKACFRNTVENILKKFYLSCNLHIKLINTIAIAALGYRMQFLIFDPDFLERLQKWVIKMLSNVHKLDYRQENDYWII